MPKFFNYLRQEDFPPSGFESSLRFVGTDYQQNYFFANEKTDYSISFDSDFNKILKDTSFNRVSFSSSFVKNFLEQKNYSISFSPKFRLNPLDTGSFLASISGSAISQTKETGSLSIDLNFSFSEPAGSKDSGECLISLSDVKINSIFIESGSNETILESFIKAANKIYNSIDIIIFTGVYGEPTADKDSADLDIVFYTGSYQGA